MSLPGIDQYAGPIREVCEILADETGGPLQPEEEKVASGPEPAASKGSDESSKGPETSKQHGLRTSTAFPAANAAAYTCKAFSGFGSESESAAICLQVSTGPLIITDIHGNAGCPYEMFVAVGKPTKPRWFVIVPPGSSGGTSVHAARLLVKMDEVVTVGARAAENDTFEKKPECTVTWSAGEP